MSTMPGLASQISTRGVRQVFGIPGSGPSLDLIDALEKEGVEFVGTLFEGSAVIMAGTQGRLSGRAGAAIGIKGPGLANMLPGLAFSSLEAFPVVTMTEAYAPGTPPGKSHKRLDHKLLTAGVTKGRALLGTDGSGFDDLASLAEAEVPGPVHLDLVEGGPAAEPPGDDPEAGKAGRLPGKILSLLEKAERPLVIAGTLAVRRGLAEDLGRLRVPVFSTAAAKGVVDERLPHAAGVFTGVGLELTPERALLPMADLIVGIGLRSNEVLAAAPFPCRSVNLDPAGPGRCSGFNFTAVADLPADAWKGSMGIIHERSWGCDQLHHTMTALRQRLLTGALLPAHVFRVLEGFFDHHARLVLDTGHFCTIGEHIWRAPRPDWFLGSGQGRYMGAGLPMALGAALLDGSIPTVAVLGDGGIGMYVGEVKCAVEHRLPLLVVLMSDGYLGSIRTRALRDGLSEKPVTVHQPSWIEVFDGLGLETVRAGSEEALERSLRSWKPERGPLYLEIAFDPEHYQAMGAGIR